MIKKEITKEGIVLIAAWAGIYTVLLVLFFQTTFVREWSMLVRLFALLGITSLFNASIMSAFLKQISSYLGKPFLKIHHFFAICGLILITLHPVTLFVYFLNPTIFLPDFSSWYDFWRLAGRPALILIYIGLVAVLLKKSIRKHWRVLHSLNYVALTFGVIHALLLASSAQSVIILGIYVGYLVVMIIAFVYKRYMKHVLLKAKRK